jgi:ectoine hydroxylase-related dioxygenase (phytanoyl-CoA dioxygenase family)
MRFRDGSHTLGELGNLRQEWKVAEEFRGTKRDKWGADSDPYAEKYPFLDEDYPVSPPIDLKAGDATIHHCLVLHSAPENTTDRPRWVLLAAYMPGDALYTGKPGNLAIEKAALTGHKLEIGEELTNEPVVYP